MEPGGQLPIHFFKWVGQLYVLAHPLFILGHFVLGGLLATSEHGQNDLNTYDELPTLYLGMRAPRFIQEKGTG